MTATRSSAHVPRFRGEPGYGTVRMERVSAMVSRCSVLLVSLWVASGVASAQSFKAAVTPLVEAS